MGGYYQQGDMWDYIAWKVDKNERMIGKSLNAPENREIMTTYIFSAGTKVWCPEIVEQTTASELPPWRDNG